MAFDSSSTKAVWACRLGTTPKKVWTATFLRRSLKALHLGRLNMQFQHDWQKDKKITALLIFWLKTEKFRSTQHYGAPLEGLTNFICRSCLGSTAMESCRLPELKYVIFSRAGGKTKKLPRSKLFLSMAFKHGFLEGSTFLFQYSSMTRAPLESCR